MITILLTGGLGYIGSHIAVELLNNGYRVVIIDNLINSKYEVFEQINKVANKVRLTYLYFYKMDLREKDIEDIFKKIRIHGVIHLAGLKSVNKSIEQPLEYYDVNVSSTINLLKIMDKYNCKNIIFSSSATVYGEQNYPVDETCKTGENITNPYGQSKFMIEKILIDLYNSKISNKWSIVILRYFNPVSAHPSGLLGEDPNNIPNNLFPHILKSAYDKSFLNIYGTDYNTHDGSCVRDFIHVSDLANAHMLSINKFNSKELNIYNVGTGYGVSVMQLINNFEKVNNLFINKNFTNRRNGDLPIVYAKIDKIKSELQWTPTKSIDDICLDGWNYYKKRRINP